jgi:hypothetical protein
MPVCDGCGAQVDEAHIRARIERLEQATRYRPIHVQVLVLDAEPPAAPEDFFYRAAAAGDSPRSAAAREYFNTLLEAAGEDPARFTSEAEALAEFQRQGIFLAHVVECPATEDFNAALARCAPSLVKRIERSYKPKYVAVISPKLAEILPSLRVAGLTDLLILDGEKPFDPTAGARASDAFTAAISEKLTKSVSNSA